MINRELQPEEIRDWKILWCYRDIERAKLVQTGTTTRDMQVAFDKCDPWETIPVPQVVLDAISPVWKPPVVQPPAQQPVIKWGHLARAMRISTLDEAGVPKIWLELYKKDMKWTTIVIERALANLYGEDIMLRIFTVFCNEAFKYESGAHDGVATSSPPVNNADSTKPAAPQAGTQNTRKPESDSETESDSDYSDDESDYETSDYETEEDVKGKGPEKGSYRKSVLRTLDSLKARMKKDGKK